MPDIFGLTIILLFKIIKSIRNEITHRMRSTRMLVKEKIVIFQKKRLNRNIYIGIKNCQSY